MLWVVAMRSGGGLVGVAGRGIMIWKRDGIKVVVSVGLDWISILRTRSFRSKDVHPTQV